MSETPDALGKNCFLYASWSLFFDTEAEAIIMYVMQFQAVL